MWLWLSYPTISLCSSGMTILETAVIETTSVHVMPHYGTAGTCRSKSLFYPNWLDTGIWSVFHLENALNIKACDTFRSGLIQISIHKIEFWKRFHNLLSCFPLICTLIVWLCIFINFWWKVMHSLMWNYKMSQFEKLLQWNFIHIHEIDPPHPVTPFLHQRIRLAF